MVAAGRRVPPEEIVRTTGFDPWFVRQLWSTSWRSEAKEIVSKGGFGKAPTFGAAELRRWASTASAMRRLPICSTGTR
ncbi:MAG: hypothetical protein U0521_08210 [Anaerolineae bacterium]